MADLTWNESAKLLMERMSDKEVLDIHMYFLAKIADLNLWKDISDNPYYIRMMKYAEELRIRMNAI